MIDRRRRSLSEQAAKTVWGQGPAGGMRSDATAGFQDVASDRQFVGGGADIASGVMENEVFEMDEFAVDPEGRTGISEVGALNPALTDRRAGDALVKTGQGDTGVKSRPHQGCHADF